jgi:hypothetical protein
MGRTWRERRVDAVAMRRGIKVSLAAITPWLFICVAGRVLDQLPLRQSAVATNGGVRISTLQIYSRNARRRSALAEHHRGVGAIFGTKLAADRAHYHLDGDFRAVDFTRDFFVGFAIRHGFKDRPFTRRQFRIIALGMFCAFARQIDRHKNLTGVDKPDRAGQWLERAAF